MLTKYNLGDKIKNNEMDGVCGTYNTERRSAYRVLLWRPEAKTPLGKLGVEGMTILKCIFKKWDGKSSTELV